MWKNAISCHAAQSSDACVIEPIAAPRGPVAPMLSWLSKASGLTGAAETLVGVVQALPLAVKMSGSGWHSQPMLMTSTGIWNSPPLVSVDSTAEAPAKSSVAFSGSSLSPNDLAASVALRGPSKWNLTCSALGITQLWLPRATLLSPRKREAGFTLWLPLLYGRPRPILLRLVSAFSM